VKILNCLFLNFECHLVVDQKFPLLRTVDSDSLKVQNCQTNSLSFLFTLFFPIDLEIALISYGEQAKSYERCEALTGNRRVGIAEKCNSIMARSGKNSLGHGVGGAHDRHVPAGVAKRLGRGGNSPFLSFGENVKPRLLK
jgi:hypothetical protein